jgi:capsular exopolysaccharide synthesis family protein
MKEVVVKLGLYAPVLKHGRVTTVSAYSESPIKIIAQQPDSIKYTSEIPFSVKGNKVLVDRVSYPMDSWHKTPWGVLMFKANETAVPSGENRPLVFYLMNPKDMANMMLMGLSVFPASKLSTILTLKYKDENTERARDVLNMLIKVYNTASIEDKNQLARNSKIFLEERLRFVVNELDSVENALKNYRTRMGVVDISEQGKVYLGSVEASDQKLSEINVQLSVLDQVESYVKGRADKGIAPSTAGLNDKSLSDLVGRLHETQMQYEKLRKTTAENNPILISLQDQVNRLKPSIEENISSQKSNLIAGRQNIASTSNKYSSMLRSIPQKEKEMIEISRQQSIKNNIYTYLLQKREEAALSFASTVSDSRVVDAAETSHNPVSPRKGLLFATAFLTAITIGAIYITLRELLNRTVTSRTDIEQKIPYPVVAEIVQSGERNPIVVGDGERKFIAEQFRHLRTSMAYLGINKEHKKILVTSSIPGEGKSFVASNLALSIALTDRKTILLEMDIRKPSLTKVFGMEDQKGISDYLSGNATLSDIVYPTEFNENLFFVPAGTLPRNPSELLSKSLLEDLLQILEKHYDTIVLETAPISAVTDGMILGRHCDLTLFVVRHGYTPKTSLNLFEDELKMQSFKKIAVVFNGLKDSRFGNDVRKYSKAYGYTS